MEMYVILETKANGQKLYHAKESEWSTTFTAAIGGPSSTFIYPDRARAEVDATWFQAKNAGAVERTKRMRKNKILPSTFEVVEVPAE
jgi:hypothetical protein